MSSARLNFVKGLAATAAAVLAMSSVLTACDSKAGAAAVVLGHRINDSDVNRYIDFSKTAPAVASQSNAVLSLSSRRDTVLSTLINERIFASLLSKNGGPMTSDERSSAETSFLTNYLNGGTEADLQTQVIQAGFSDAFTQAYLTAQLQEQVLLARKQITSQAQLTTFLDQNRVNPSVSGRYGTWSASSFAVTSYTAPDFVLPRPTPTPTSTTSG